MKNKKQRPSSLAQYFTCFSEVVSSNLLGDRTQKHKRHCMQSSGVHDTKKPSMLYDRFPFAVWLQGSGRK